MSQKGKTAEIAGGKVNHSEFAWPNGRRCLWFHAYTIRRVREVEFVRCENREIALFRRPARAQA